jgi:hypothetical protein
VDPVGADHHVGLDLAAVLELRDRDAAVRLNPDAPRSQRDDVARQRMRQHVEQVGAMSGRTRAAEQCGLLAAARLRDHPAGFPMAGHRPLPTPGDRADVVLEVERAEHLHRVRAERNPGADLAQLGRRLVYGDLDVAAAQRPRRRQATDPAADDRNTRHSDRDR